MEVSFIVEEIGVPGENHRPGVGFDLTMLVVIGTDCIGSYKSNYDTITITTIPSHYRRYWNAAIQ